MSMLVEQEKSKYDRMWDYPGYKFWNGPSRVTKFMDKCFTGKHSMDSNYLGFNWAKIRGNGAFWAGELGKHWDKIEAIQSKEHALRYITIGRN